MNSFIKLSAIVAASIVLFSFKSTTPPLGFKPDLKVQSIIPTRVGDNLVITITIKNVGNAHATTIFDNYIELNNANEPSPNPKRVQTRLMAGLKAQQSKTIEVIYPADSVHPGDIAVTVITDSKASRVPESNENNNKRKVNLPQ
ncbi:MAG: hypothetical protein LCH91_20150 [Bacteroidetes bacterium]|nr:hypothetical protein [Bacteroidota bacterium]